MQSQPAAGPPFSKGQVNRAGRVLLGVAEATSHLGADRAAAEIGPEEIVLAFQAVRCEPPWVPRRP
jgi:hypothetical protein